MKFNDLLNKWLTEKQLYEVKRRTFLRYAEVIRAHVSPILGDYDVEEISASVLNGFQRDKLTRGNLKTGEPLSPNTVRNVISIVKNALEYGRKEYSLSIVDFSKVSAVKFQERPIAVFTKDEQKKIEAAVLGSKKDNHYGVILCLYTGLRLGFWRRGCSRVGGFWGLSAVGGVWLFGSCVSFSAVLLFGAWSAWFIFCFYFTALVVCLFFFVVAVAFYRDFCRQKAASACAADFWV